MTRAEWERVARDRWSEAHGCDPAHAEEIGRIVLGAEVWCWSSLPMARLRALAAALYPTVLRGRG